MGKHRHEQFREAWSVVRIDGFHSPDAPDNMVVTVKEVWLTAEKADAEVERLNALWRQRDPGDASVRYLSQYTRLERDDCRERSEARRGRRASTGTFPA